MNSAILLSGGIDSVSLAYLRKPDIAFTINYGQKPALAEEAVSKKICSILGIVHETIDVDLSALGTGLLNNSDPLTIAPSAEWWPFRNQMLVTLACMKGISYGIKELVIGSVISDSFHKDGTITFYEKLNSLLEYQEGEIKVLYPAIHMTSDELVVASKIPLDILLWAHSCHTSNISCGHCPGCLKHLAVKQRLGLN